MDNPLLKYLAFLKTVETGSFTRAAQALDYAQSSISKMVADLEQEWGTTLLERSKKGVCLTSAGAQLLPFLRKVLHDHQELEGQICRMNGVETGVVRIGTFASVAINWLPNIFARLQQDYPGIEYEMLLGDYDEVARWIQEGRVDCGFLRLPAPSGFDTILLKQDEYKLVLPAGHPLAGHETVAIEALNGLPFLLLEHGGKTEVSELLERCGNGGTGHGRQHPAGHDPAAYPLPARDPRPADTLLPPHWSCHEARAPSGAGRPEIHRVSALPGNGVIALPEGRLHRFRFSVIMKKHCGKAQCGIRNREDIDMSRTENVELTVVCLLEDGDRLLLQNRVKEDWHGYALPGGHVEPGESFVDAVIREMKEETGLDIRHPALVGVKQFPIETGRYVVLLFKAVEWSGTLTSSEEGEMKWVAYSRLSSLQTVDDLQEMLHMMNTPELTEFQYLLRDGQWLVSIK